MMPRYFYTLMSPFEISIATLDGRKVINFANRSPKFVEVVFAIDGKEVKYNKAVSADTKGYAYPPNLEKPVRMTMDNQPLTFRSSGGVVQAYIFEGDGQFKDEDIDIPTFIRSKIVKKVTFKRKGDRPIEILEVRY